ncbi:ribonuclease h1 [Colletotrichum incanum]|uniref:Ribonuclease h1 n=1 Tax=Colletotrichum incanum TaxID=1573173 RepID=A0A161YBW6_COLIC|nr:ribonuclease h1 [Colletotrichum incanum]
MAPRKTKATKFYAVFEGRVDEPTIYSSWGDAHPRVTGCSAVFKGFSSLQKALNYMEDLEVLAPRRVIKEGAGASTPDGKSDGYYAVANGKNPGIYQYWRGQTQALSQLHETPGACCKKFRTKEQAEAFIEEWKQAVADVLVRSIREALDQGMRPKDMSLDISGLFDWNQNDTDSHDEAVGLDFEALSIQDTQT